MLGEPQMWVTYLSLKLLVATLESKKETGKIIKFNTIWYNYTFIIINFINIVYLTEYMQTIIISTCNQCNNINEIF